jgi:hypothetical protein
MGWQKTDFSASTAFAPQGPNYHMLIRISHYSSFDAAIVSWTENVAAA